MKQDVSSSRIRVHLAKLFRSLKAFVFQAFKTAIHFPKTALLIVLVLSVYFTYRSELMPRFFTMEDTLDPLLPSIQATKTLEREFKAGQSLYISIFSLTSKGIPAPALCRLQRWFNSGVYNIEKTPPLVTVVTPFHISEVVKEGDKLWFPPLMKPDCDKSEPLPSRNFIDSSSAMPAVLNSTPWAGILSRETHGGDLLVQLIYQRDNTKYAYPETVFAVERSLKNVLSEFPDISWHLSGDIAFRGHAKAATDYDLRINTAIPIVIAILFRIIFGSWIGGLLIGISLVFMRSMLMGTMAICGYSADPLTGSLLLLVSLSAIADFLFLTRFKVETGLDWKHCYRRFLIPCFLTSLTTSIGYLTLMISEIETVRDLGKWAAFGTFLQWFSIFFVLPCVHAVWPRSRHWAHKRDNLLSRLGLTLSAWSLSGRFKALVFPLLGLALATGPYLHLEDSIDSFFDASHPFRQATQYLRDSRNWDGSISVIIKPGYPEAERSRLLETIKALPNVARIDSGRDMMRFVKRGLPRLDSEMVERLVSTSDQYQSYFAQDGAEHVHVYIKKSNLDQIRSVMNSVSSNCPASICAVAGSLPIFVDFSQAVVASLFESFGVSLFIVSLFLVFYVWWCRKSCYLAVITSALWGPLVMMAVMALFRIPINFVSSFFAAILVGVSGDNAIQYLYAAGNREIEVGIESRSRGSIEVTLLMIAVCGMLLGSAFEPPKVLGLTLILGLVTNLFGDLWILKLLLGENKSPWFGKSKPWARKIGT